MVASVLLIGLGVGLGLEYRRAALLGVVLLLPVPAIVLVAIHSWRHRTRPSTRAAVFCEAVAGELRAGASLRSALERASLSVESRGLARLCRLGAPLAELARGASEQFPEIRREIGAVIDGLSRLGAPAAPLFDEMASIALAKMEVAHEVRTASAPARATALVMLGVPSLLTLGAVLGGRFQGYLDTSPQRVAAGLGLVLVLVGLLVAALILQRSR